MGRVGILVTVSIGLVVGRATAAPGDPAPAPPLRVAVIPGVAVNLDPSRVDALGQDLAQALSAELVVDAVGGLEVRRLLPVEGLRADCATNPTCTADVARRTNAQQLLFVVMVETGGTVQIDTTWVEPSSGHQASRPAIDLTGPSDAEAKAKFEAAAHDLLPDLAMRPKPRGGMSLDTKMTEGTPRHFTTPALITAAAGGVGLVAGIAFGLETRSKYNSCDASAATCTESQKASIRHWGLAADVSFGIALGGAIASAALFATSGESPHVIVSPTAEGAGVTVVGRF